MKIINAGIKPQPKRDWWLDIELTCRNCGCVFQLEEGDEKRADVTIVQAAARLPAPLEQRRSWHYSSG